MPIGWKYCNILVCSFSLNAMRYITKGRVQSRKKKIVCKNTYLGLDPPPGMEKYNLSPLKIEKISLHFWMNWAILHTLKKRYVFC